jgi:hypothetical protein
VSPTASTRSLRGRACRRAGIRSRHRGQGARSDVAPEDSHAAGSRASPCASRAARVAGLGRPVRGDRKHRERHACPTACTAQPFEHRESVLIAGDRLAIDQAGTHPEPVNGLDDERIARSPVVPIAGQQADAGWVSARHQAIAVMLDLVNPVRAGRSAVGWGWEAGFDKTGGHLGAVYRLRPSRPLAISPDRWRPASRWAWPSRGVLPISRYRIGCTPGRGHRG